MDTLAVKQSLHKLIDQIEDNELLTLYKELLERGIRKDPPKDYFKTTEEDLVDRAKASLESVEAGRTRSISEFKKDVEAWKNQQGI